MHLLDSQLHPLAAARTIRPREAAKLCGCSVWTIYRAARRGELDVRRVNGAVHLIALVDLQIWYVKNYSSLLTTRRSKVGRPWGSHKVST